MKAIAFSEKPKRR